MNIEMKKAVLAIVGLFNIIFMLAALRWINNLHKYNCTCAEEWRLKYIRIFLMISIVYTVLFLSQFVFHGIEKFMLVLGPLMSLATVVYSGISLSYFIDLRKRECMCSAGPQARLMYIMSFIQVVLVGMGLLLGGLAGGLVVARTGKL